MSTLKLNMCYVHYIQSEKQEQKLSDDSISILRRGSQQGKEKHNVSNDVISHIIEEGSFMILETVKWSTFLKVCLLTISNDLGLCEEQIFERTGTELL